MRYISSSTNCKRILSLLVVLMAVLSSCVKKADTVDSSEPYTPEVTASPAAENIISGKGKALYVNCSTGFENLNPYTVLNEELLTVLSTVFEPAIRLSADGTFEPNVIKSWSVDETGLVYTFNIQRGVSLHDPEFGYINAERLKSIIDTLKVLPAEESYYSQYSSCIEFASVIDEYTLQVRTIGPSQNVLYFMCFPVVPTEFYSEGIISADYEPIGTGPFKFDSIDNSGRLVLKRNDSYWKQKPEIESIIVSTVENPHEAIQKYRDGELNCLLTDLLNAKTICGSSNSSTYSEITNQFDCLIPGRHSVIFKNENMRIAISSAINRKKLIMNALGGMGTSAYTPMKPDITSIRNFDYLPMSEVEIRDEIEHLGYYLEEGMYVDQYGKELKVRLAYYENEELPYRAKVATEITNQLKAFGITVQCDKLSREEFEIQLGLSDYDLFLTSYSMEKNNDISFLFSEISSYKSGELNTCLNNIKTAFDEEKNSELLLEAYKILLNDMPVIGLYYKNYLMIIDDGYDSVIPASYPDMFSGIYGWTIK